MKRTIIPLIIFLSIFVIAGSIAPVRSYAQSSDDLLTKGRSLYAQGDFKNAVTTLREAITMDPSNKRLWRAYNDAYQADSATRFMATLTGKYNAITFEEYVERKSRNPDLVLIDLRGAKDFEKEHMPGAINIPLEELRFRQHELPELKIAEIIVYCVAGPRSATGQMYLSMLGYTNVKYFQGGFRRYKDYLEMEESEETVEGIKH